MCKACVGSSPTHPAMAKDKEKEALYRAEKLRRYEARKVIKRIARNAQLKERAKWRQWEYDRDNY